MGQFDMEGVKSWQVFASLDGWDVMDMLGLSEPKAEFSIFIMNFILRPIPNTLGYWNVCFYSFSCITYDNGNVLLKKTVNSAIILLIEHEICKEDNIFL